MKQVIILRKDLNMRKGKMIAQGAHASLKATRRAELEFEDWWDKWFFEDMKKIVVSVNSEAELHAAFQKALTADLPAELIKDAGYTEFKEPTFTAVAIGPAPDELVDLITKELPLL